MFSLHFLEIFFDKFETERIKATSLETLTLRRFWHSVNSTAKSDYEIAYRQLVGNLIATFAVQGGQKSRRNRLTSFGHQGMTSRFRFEVLPRWRRRCRRHPGFQPLPSAPTPTRQSYGWFSIIYVLPSIGPKNPSPKGHLPKRQVLAHNSSGGFNYQDNQNMRLPRYIYQGVFPPCNSSVILP